jgi:hypothetical protein
VQRSLYYSDSIAILRRLTASLYDLAALSKIPSPISSPEIAAGNQPGGEIFSYHPESRFVLAGCGVRAQGTPVGESSVRDSSLDWRRVLRLAEHHGVASLIHVALQEVREAVPQTVLGELSPAV